MTSNGLLSPDKSGAMPGICIPPPAYKYAAFLFPVLCSYARHDQCTAETGGILCDTVNHHSWSPVFSGTLLYSARTLKYITTTDYAETVIFWECGNLADCQCAGQRLAEQQGADRCSASSQAAIVGGNGIYILSNAAW